MSYSGPIPQNWVEALAPHLSKDNNGGRVLAEHVCRENIEAMTSLFEDKEVPAELARRIPLSVITGQRITRKDVV